MLKQMEDTTDPSKIVKKYTVKYKNNVEEELPSIDKMTAADNSGVWEIQNIQITVSDEERYLSKKSISITWKKASIRPISYIIKGEDRNWVYLTSSALDERIKKIKRINFQDGEVRMWFIIISVSCSILGFTLSQVDIILDSLHKPSLSVIPITLLILGLLALAALPTTRYLFPAYTFYWGDYVQTFDRRQSRGKFVLFGVIIIVLLGIAASVIANMLTR